MDRFLLARNPMTGHGVAIVHTIEPVGIIEVAEGIAEGESTKTFDLKGKKYSLTMVFGYSSDLGADVDQEIGKLLDRAWRWYRSFLDWKDKAMQPSGKHAKFMMTVDEVNQELYVLHREYPAFLAHVVQTAPHTLSVIDIFDEIDFPDADLLDMPVMDQLRDFVKTRMSKHNEGNDN